MSVTRVKINAHKKVGLTFFIKDIRIIEILISEKNSNVKEKFPHNTRLF